MCLCVGELSEERGGVFWSLLLRFSFSLSFNFFFAKQSKKFPKFGGHLMSVKPCQMFFCVFGGSIPERNLLSAKRWAFREAKCSQMKRFLKCPSLFFSFLSCDALDGKTWSLFFSVWHLKICNTTASISINVMRSSKEIMNYAFQNACYHFFKLKNKSTTIFKSCKALGGRFYWNQAHRKLHLAGLLFQENLTPWLYPTCKDLPKCF